MTNVFGYIRVSGKGQLEGDGIDRQKDTILRYCEAKQFRIVRWFVDGAVSGTVEAEDRPQFAEMLMTAGPATSVTIIVERADRLARQLTVSELACEEARKNGLTILEAASDTDLTNSDDPTRVLVRQVLGALSEWNKNVIVKRLHAARRRQKARTGRCEGAKPFAFDGKEHDLETLSLIVNFRNVDKMSWNAIARELRRRGRGTKHGDETSWHLTSVKRTYRAEMQRRMEAERPPQPKLLDGLAI